MEIGGHIRVHPHMTYHLGAAKLVVTGGQNVIFWHFRALKDTIPLMNIGVRHRGVDKVVFDEHPADGWF